MFHVVGDIHGNLEIGKVVDYFKEQKKFENCQKKITSFYLGT